MNDESRPKPAPESPAKATGTSVPLATDNATEARPTAADITALLRSRPRDGDPAEVRAEWLERKRSLIRAVEEATR